MLSAGDVAPDFTLPDERGQLVTLSALLASGPVALFFYPADFTPICTREVCMVRDVNAALAAAGLGVFGISHDSVESHARFRAKHGLTFPLLADVDRAMKDFGYPVGPVAPSLRRSWPVRHGHAPRHVSHRHRRQNSRRGERRFPRGCTPSVLAARRGRCGLGTPQPWTVTMMRRRCARVRCSHK